MKNEPDPAPEMVTSLCPVPVWMSFLWGIAESTLFFIVPDIILGWACLTGVKNGLKSLAAVLAGAVLGGLLMFGFAMHWPEASLSLVSRLPLVRDWMIADVSRSYLEHGVAGMLFGPSSGIPYKVYAVLAPPHADALTFALVSVPARMERLALSWAAFTLMGLALRRWRPLRSRSVPVIFIGLWIAIYAWYWSAL